MDGHSDSEIDAILDAFANADCDLPKDALRLAGEIRERCVPAFLAEIDRFVARPDEIGGRADVIFFIFHVLGEWRETAAYRPLVRLLRSPRGVLDPVLGDAITVTLHRVMAAVFDGDVEPLQTVILDTQADEFVRSRMCETLTMLVLDGRLPRDEAVAFFRGAFDTLMPVTDCYVWSGWLSAVAALGASELVPLAKEAFARGSIDSTWLEYRHFEQDLAYALANPASPWQRDDAIMRCGATRWRYSRSGMALANSVSGRKPAPGSVRKTGPRLRHSQRRLRARRSAATNRALAAAARNTRSAAWALPRRRSLKQT
jgi:hypothetical protein